MTDSMVLQIVRDALITALVIAVPILGVGMLVGLVVSIFQATTQIQEQSLSFVPKLLAVLLTILLMAPWIMNVLVGYTNDLFSKIPLMVK